MSQVGLPGSKPREGKLCKFISSERKLSKGDRK